MIAPARGPGGDDRASDRDHPDRIEADHAPRATLSPVEIVSATCPYLESAGGGWRNATPSRDHRCAAVDPPTAQTIDKQRRHCLAPEHVDCTLFRAARAARATSLAGGADPALVDAADRRRRPLPRTAPILLEPPGLVDQVVRLQFDRGPGQLALIGLMIVAFVIVALTRLPAGPAAIAPSANPSFVAVASALPSPTPTLDPSPSASVAPSAAPEPSFRATYKVKKGDTLAGIAHKFNTSVTRIRNANGLKGSSIKIGQVLKIP